MYYVYQFLNASDEVLYIGITGDIKKRIQLQHFAGSGHLPEACYKDTYMVLYSECVSEDDAKIKERYFINKLNPEYNTRMNKGSRFSFTLPSLEWVYLPVDRDKLSKRKKEKQKVETENNQHKILEEIKALDNLILEPETLSYASLNAGQFNLYNKLSVEPITIKTGHFRGGNYRFSLVMINSELWTFYEQLNKVINIGMNNRNLRVSSLIPLLNNYELDINNFCVATLAGPLRRDIMRSSKFPLGYGYNSTKAILIKPGAIKSALIAQLEYEEKKLQDKLDKKGEFTYSCFEDPTKRKFHSMDEFFSYCVRVNNIIGIHLENIEKVNNLFIPYANSSKSNQ